MWEGEGAKWPEGDPSASGPWGQAAKTVQVGAGLSSQAAGTVIPVQAKAVVH